MCQTNTISKHSRWIADDDDDDDDENWMKGGGGKDDNDKWTLTSASCLLRKISF